MDTRLLIAGLMLLCGLHAPAAVAMPVFFIPPPPGNTVHSGLTLELGGDFGGDNLRTVNVAGHYADSGYMGVGEGVYFGLGLVARLGDSRFGLKPELQYHANNSCPIFDDSNDYCPYVFSHVDYNALLLFDLGPTSMPWQLVGGVGITLHRQPIFQVEDRQFQPLFKSDFQDARGWIAQVQYAGLGLRMTRVLYHLRDSPTVLDGTTFGFFLSWGF